MSKLYSYVMRQDTGMAPNPFWNICTLAVCTPNHQGSRVRTGDWIAGVSDKASGYKLTYAMEIAERIHMDDYFRAERFAAKKPILNGTAQQRCGDNFYSLGLHGWSQHANLHHVGSNYLAKDTRHPWVFVARRRFWYLGREAVDMPETFMLMFGGRGARVNHPPELVESFKDWVQTSLQAGRNALPRDFEGDGCGRRSVNRMQPPRKSSTIC